MDLTSIVEFVAIWVVSALPTAWLAERKGRQFNDWFWAGMFLGVFGIPLVLLCSPAQLELIERQKMS